MSENAVRPRAPSEILKRGYSDEEVDNLYELGRFLLENGDLRRAEMIFTGITEIAPDYSPAWLGVCTVETLNSNNDAALAAARQAVRVDPDSLEATLFLIQALLSVKDLTAAGSYLGEVGERIESEAVENPNLIRFYRAQLGRYQGR